MNAGNSEEEPTDQRPESAIWLLGDWVKCLSEYPPAGLPIANDYADLRISMYQRNILLLLAEIAAAAFAEDVRFIELGRGDEPYKFDLGAEQRHLRDLLPQCLDKHAWPVRYVRRYDRAREGRHGE
jgi:hypothetical protein